jgi:hypothetical protein
MNSLHRSIACAAAALLILPAWASAGEAEVSRDGICSFGIALNGLPLASGIIILDSRQNPVAVYDERIAEVLGEDFIIIFDSRLDPDRLPGCDRELLGKVSASRHAWVRVTDLSRATGSERALRLERRTLSAVDRTSLEEARERRLPLAVRDRGTVSRNVLVVTDGRERAALIPLADLAAALGIQPRDEWISPGDDWLEPGDDWLEPGDNWLHLRGDTRGILLSAGDGR